MSKNKRKMTEKIGGKYEHSNQNLIPQKITRSQDDHDTGQDVYF